MSPGEKRRRQAHRARKQAEYDARLAMLKVAHPEACCANCNLFEAKVNMGPQNVCLLASDFHGYAITKPDALCASWKGVSRATPTPIPNTAASPALDRAGGV